MAKLVIFRGDAVENEIHLTGSTLRIGRENRNDIVIDDSSNSVSRVHAEIRAEGGRYFVADLNSRNGVWINGRRIKGKTALELGVPVTVGIFELVLEDDASTGEFDESSSSQLTVMRTPAVARRDGPSGARWRSASPFATTRHQAFLWAGAAAALLVVCAIPFVVVRYKTQPEPPAAVVEPPVVPQAPPQQMPLATDPTKSAIAQHLRDARSMMDAGDFAGALRDHLQTVLELEPENAEALELKRRADEAITAAATQERRAPPTVAGSETPSEVETPGIERRPGEVWADYTARVKRIQIALSEGKTSLDKQEFTVALGRFREVERDQPKYQGVDRLITDALSKQQKAFEEATSTAQQNEQAGKLREARLWYRRALEIDPSSTSAREKSQSLLARINAEATKLFDRATLAVKLHEKGTAVRLFQQILDLMLPGDEIREKAAKQLEALKQ